MDPERFDLMRDNLDEHQAFGARGRHFCLGAAARPHGAAHLDRGDARRLPGHARWTGPRGG